MQCIAPTSSRCASLRAPAPAPEPVLLSPSGPRRPSGLVGAFSLLFCSVPAFSTPFAVQIKMHEAVLVEAERFSGLDVQVRSKH